MDIWVIYGEYDDWEEMVFITHLKNLKETTDHVRGHVIGCGVYRLTGDSGKWMVCWDRGAGMTAVFSRSAGSSIVLFYSL